MGGGESARTRAVGLGNAGEEVRSLTHKLENRPVHDLSVYNVQRLLQLPPAPGLHSAASSRSLPTAAAFSNQLPPPRNSRACYVQVRTSNHIHTHTTYAYMYICGGVSVCVDVHMFNPQITHTESPTRHLCYLAHRPKTPHLGHRVRTIYPCISCSSALIDAPSLSLSLSRDSPSLQFSLHSLGFRLVEIPPLVFQVHLCVCVCVCV